MATRREAMIGGGALGLSLLVPRALAQGGKTMPGIVYVGCRTSRERNAKGDGIQVYRADPAGGAWQPVQLVGDLVNPSYLILNAAGTMLYTVHGDGSEISGFRVDRDSGRLTLVTRATTGGRNPVHLVIHPHHSVLLVANHVVSGEVRSGLASIGIRPDGTLTPQPLDVVAFEGKVGPHRVEQPFPKPHQIEPDRAGRFFAVPDKGCDRVDVYTVGADGRFAAVEQAAAVAREGSGPRHIAFHPGARFAYAINELDSTVTAYAVDPASGALTPFQILSSLPDSFTGNSRGAEIAVSADGRFVYASNRGDDSIATFAIDARSGRLAARGWTATGGRTPRFFAIAPGGQALFAANEESHNIVRLPIGADGVPTTGTTVAETGSPTCILFA
jgi:6-phosphogluconolactonase